MSGYFERLLSSADPRTPGLRPASTLPYAPRDTFEAVPAEEGRPLDAGASAEAVGHPVVAHVAPSPHAPLQVADAPTNDAPETPRPPTRVPAPDGRASSNRSADPDAPPSLLRRALDRTTDPSRPAQSARMGAPDTASVAGVTGNPLLATTAHVPSDEGSGVPSSDFRLMNATHATAVAPPPVPRPPGDHSGAAVSGLDGRRRGTDRAFDRANVAAPTDVHITIGRIEVTAVHPPAASPRKPREARAPMSLDDYLTRRQKGGA
jgi:hypothetical protein